MNTALIILSSLLALTLTFIAFPDGATSLLIVLAFSGLAVYLIRRYSDDSVFICQVFIGGLLIRMLLALVIYSYDLYDFFGPDARFYDLVGMKLIASWDSSIVAKTAEGRQIGSTVGAGWGMNYLTAIIYYLVGRNMLAVQMFCVVIGAATSPITYFCAKNLYGSQKVARASAVLVAFFPAMIIWSSQMLKDGLILFLLVLAITMVLQLQKKISLPATAFLVFSLFGLLSLRFYIFYMTAAAAAGSFLVGTSSTTQSLVRRLVVVLMVGISLGYLGVFKNVSSEVSTYGNLEKLQASRQYASEAATSGFGDASARVNTVSGFLTILPVGLIYLMLAPFPWEVANFRQAITLPEVFLWWSLIPLAVFGLWYTLKNRFRESIPVLIFTFILSVAYALYQGNVGTAYRQRTQIQVFLFIFIAVGWTLYMEKRADRRLLEERRRNRPDIQQRPVLNRDFN